MIVYLLLSSTWAVSILVVTLILLTFTPLTVDQAIGSAIGIVSVPGILFMAVGAFFFGEKKINHRNEWITVNPGRQVKRVV